MLFLRPTTRLQPVQCFFCLSHSLLQPQPKNSQPSITSKRKGKDRIVAIAEPGTKSNWQCERCGCWNIRDQKTGEMISDLPAMHDSELNSKSFSLRALPSSNHLPRTSTSMSASSFCHSCLSNQTLTMNMLANYLPDDNDPSYPVLYANLPNYIASLNTRYPPVCTACRPAVEDAMQRADEKGRIEAWNNALDRGNRVKERLGGSEWRVRSSYILIWILRGGLWWIGMILSWLQGVLVCIAPRKLQAVFAWKPVVGMDISSSIILIFFHIFSILWIVWDPNWLHRVRIHDLKRPPGRGIWVRNMLLIMVLRILAMASFLFANKDDTSSQLSLLFTRTAFVLEIGLFLHAVSRNQVKQPVTVKLVRMASLPSPAQTASTPPHLSLSQNIPSSSFPSHSNIPANPVFGQPSLLQPVEEAEPEPMDWEPTPSVSNTGFSRPPGLSPDEDLSSKFDWDKFATNKQRIFPQSSHEETGLEFLLESWKIGGGSESLQQSKTQIIKKGKVIKHRDFGCERVIQVVTFGLVVLRILGMGTIWISATPPYSQKLYISNVVFLALELLAALYRLYSVVQAHPTSLLSTCFVIFDGVFRGMAMAEYEVTDILLERVGNARSKCFRWLFWGFMNLIGLFV
ncbi:uncharacterized protein L203_104969 [Cryptococcus depauperatus CBS 7841]|uniref:Ima1 N-terminal domain-containing protein n=1 Tax=Cryptococcus depauperatus CBS 7841 TaxID=1295531 RepID=A0AAJ8JWQ1_9TREE